MIDKAIQILADRLNQHLGARFSVDDDIVVASPLVDASGGPVATTRNQLVLFVANIDQDTMPRNSELRAGGGSSVTRAQPPLHLNVYVMIAANYDPENYTEALKVLSGALQYFQANPVLDASNAPEFGQTGLQKLQMEISNLGIETVGHLWGVSGGRYLPSVLYRMRTVSIDANAVIREDLTIRAPAPQVAPS